MCGGGEGSGTQGRVKPQAKREGLGALGRVSPWEGRETKQSVGAGTATEQKRLR